MRDAQLSEQDFAVLRGASAFNARTSAAAAAVFASDSCADERVLLLGLARAEPHALGAQRVQLRLRRLQLLRKFGIARHRLGEAGAVLPQVLQLHLLRAEDAFLLAPLLLVEPWARPPPDGRCF